MVIVRKWFLALLFAVFLSTIDAYASSAQDWLLRTEPAIDQRQIQTGTRLTIGTTTTMSDYFATDLWGVNTADLDVRNLLHGYQTVVWADGRSWFNGSVIQHVSMETMEDGSQVILMEISDNLVYSDGMPLTARDYVFSLLLEASPAVKTLGGASRDLSFIKGFSAYQEGMQECFTGVRLFSDTEFALQIEQDSFSNYYGPGLLMITPYPSAVIAPGYRVRDDGNGVFLETNGNIRELTVDCLLQSLLDLEHGYARKPMITSGPYMLSDINASEGKLTFVVNPYFAGDAWGFRPVIETLYFVRVDEADIVCKLSEKEIDLMNKVLSPAVVAQATNLPGLNKAVYPRTGLAYLSFTTENGLGRDQITRKAIAMSLNRNAFVENYGLERVYGYYGPGQWIVSQVSAEALLSLDIPFDCYGANKLLDGTEWYMSEDGGKFIPGGGKIRYRDNSGTLEPMQVVFAKSYQSSLASGVEVLLREGLAEIGIQLQVDNLSFSELLAQIYHQQARTADLYFMGSDFHAAFNPLNVFTDGTSNRGYYDTTSVRDDILVARAKAMMTVGFGNRAGYIDAWFAFQRRFVETLPMIPLYSGMYYDFYSPKLVGYDVTTLGSWANAIVRAELTEAQ